MSPRWILVVAAVGSACAAPAIAAEPAWHTGIQLAPPATSPGPPAASLAARGNAVAAWTISLGDRSRIQVRARPGFVSPWRIEWTSGTYRASPAAPAVGANPAGAAVVVWRVPGGPVRSAIRATRTGPWRVLAVPSPRADGRREFVSPQVAVAADGSASVVWAALEGGAWVVRGARRGATGPWTATPVLMPNVGRTEPTVRVNPSGDAVAAWVVPRPGSQTITPEGEVRVARRIANGEWEDPVTLGQTESGADVSIAPDGRAIAAWSVVSASPGGHDVVLARSGPGGGWSAPEVVAPGSTPRIAVNGSGALIAAWAGPAPAPGRREPLRAAVNHGGGWSPPAVLGPWSDGTFGAIENLRTRVAMSESGRAFLTWVDSGVPGYEVGAATAGPDGVFAGFRSIADSPDMALAPDGNGNALVLYPEGTATGGTISAAGFDRHPRPVVTAGADGAWLVRRNATRWTITVRNRGAVVARGVELRISVCCGDRFVSSAPPGDAPSSRSRRWRLGTLRPGASRRVHVVTQPGPLARAPRGHFGDVRAIGVRPRGVAWGPVRRPPAVVG